MNDGNDKYEGAWWGNLETLKPSQVQSDYSYVALFYFDADNHEDYPSSR